MDLRDIFGEGNVKIADVAKEFRRVTGRGISVDSEETESELISDADQTLVDSEETESELISNGDAQDSVDSESSEEVPLKYGWIKNAPEWNPPTHLALHMANSSSTPEWRKACYVICVVDTMAEGRGEPIDVTLFEGPLFTTLTIKPSKTGLKKLRHAIQQPVQPPYIREVIFDCQDIQTREDVDNLEKYRELLVEILKLLYEQTGDAVHPIRDALILLLEAWLCAIGTKKEVWCGWNMSDPRVQERMNRMTAGCSLTYLGLGPHSRDLTKFHVDFDYGLDIGQLTVSESGEKTVQEVWMNIFEDALEFQFGQLLINGWPGTEQEGLDYNLTVFETMLMETKLRRIEIRNTKLHVGGLLSLLDRNKDALDILILESVDTDDGPGA
jgi:hypothetical protein